MLTLVGILMTLVVGFCFGRLSALEAPEVKRITAMYLEQRHEFDEQYEELELTKSELADVKNQLGGLGATISKLSE